MLLCTQYRKIIQLLIGIYENRIYGMKNLLKEIINKVKKYRCVTLYGEEKSGKTSISLEICKYFYMNKYFKEGIFYINLKKIGKIKNQEELKFLFKNNKKNEENDVLLVFDNFDLIKRNNFIKKLNAHFIIITQTRQDDLYEKFKEKNKPQKNNIEEIENLFGYQDVDVPIDEKSAKELFNYLKIINKCENISEAKFNNIKHCNEEIHVKHIIQKIQNEVEDKKNKKENKFCITSSQLKY